MNLDTLPSQQSSPSKVQNRPAPEQPLTNDQLKTLTTGSANAPETPTHPASPSFLAVKTKAGEQVTLVQEQGQWHARVWRGSSTGSVPVERLPIRSNGDIPQILASLAEYDNPGYRARRVRVVRPAGGGDPFVHVGALGLAGGDDNDPPTQSDQPNRHSSGVPGAPTQRTRRGSLWNMVKKIFKKEPHNSSIVASGAEGNPARTSMIGKAINRLRKKTIENSQLAVSTTAEGIPESTAPKAAAPKPQQGRESKPVEGGDKPFSNFFKNQTQENQTPALTAAQPHRLQRNTNRNSLVVLQERIEKEPRIDTTQKLVEALNRSENSSLRAKELRRWFQQYINWFESQSVNSLHDGDLEEFTALASLTADSDENKELLRKYLSVLDKKVKDPHFKKALHNVANRHTVCTKLRSFVKDTFDGKDISEDLETIIKETWGFAEELVKALAAQQPKQTATVPKV